MKKYLSELFGTFCLVLFGCGATAIARGILGTIIWKYALATNEN